MLNKYTFYLRKVWIGQFQEVFSEIDSNCVNFFCSCTGKPRWRGGGGVGFQKYISVIYNRKADTYMYIWKVTLYSWFHIKGTWSVHSFNGDYLSISEGTGSCGYLFHEIPGRLKQRRWVLLLQINILNPASLSIFFKKHLTF